MKEYSKVYNIINKDILKEKSKNYSKNNKSKRAEYGKKYRKENKEKIAARKKRYFIKNKDNILEKQNKYRRERLKTNVIAKLTTVLRDRLHSAMRSQNFNKIEKNIRFSRMFS